MVQSERPNANKILNSYLSFNPREMKRWELEYKEKLRPKKYVERP